MENSVIEILRRAVEAEPDNLVLREHFSEVLFRAGQWSEALAQSQQILARNPVDWTALGYASAAAAALNNHSLARQYESLRNAITPSESHPSPSSSKPHCVSAHHSHVRLADVAGMEDTKHRLQLTVFNTWRNPELTRAYGQRLRGGLLLYGPPGCGKTFLARAVAGELGAAFVSIGLTDILDMFFGESEKNLTRIFQSARQNSPSVLFFDEIDALGRKRTLRHDAGRELVNVLLSELDGVGSNNDDIFVIAATNHPWDIDVALRRPGRLDRTLFIPPPDQPARRALFELAMRQRPVASLDFDWLAGRTHGWSGADIVHLCNSATEIALAKALDQNRVEPIAMEHLRTGLSSIKPSVRSWFETARNFALFANAAGDWDDLLAYMKAERMV